MKRIKGEGNKREVKGIMLLDYVRMYRKNKDLEWKEYLRPEDFRIIGSRINTLEWYPFETFQRLGYAIFMLVGKGNPELVRLWGKLSAQEINNNTSNFLKGTTIKHSVEKFLGIIKAFFRPNIYDVKVEENGANCLVLRADSLEKKSPAVLPYTWQVIGSVEAIIEIMGCKNTQVRLISKEWEGDPQTVIKMTWE